MTRVQRVVLLAGASAWLGAGVVQFWHQSATAQRSPAWATDLASLADAPIPPGAAVALLEPITQRAEEIKPLLLEAAWQRPDLHWAFFASFPRGRSPDELIALGATLPPPGWREIWRRGVVTLYRKEPR